MFLPRALINTHRSRYDDLLAIFQALHVVINNRNESVGGGGTPGGGTPTSATDLRRRAGATGREGLRSMRSIARLYCEYLAASPAGAAGSVLPRAKWI